MFSKRISKTNPQNEARNELGKMNNARTKFLIKNNLYIL